MHWTIQWEIQGVNQTAGAWPYPPVNKQQGRSSFKYLLIAELVQLCREAKKIKEGGKTGGKMYFLYRIQVGTEKTLIIFGR